MRIDPLVNSCHEKATTFRVVVVMDLVKSLRRTGDVRRARTRPRRDRCYSAQHHAHTQCTRTWGSSRVTQKRWAAPHTHDRSYSASISVTNLTTLPPRREVPDTKSLLFSPAVVVYGGSSPGMDKRNGALDRSTSIWVSKPRSTVKVSTIPQVWYEYERAMGDSSVAHCPLACCWSGASGLASKVLLPISVPGNLALTE